MNGDLEGKVFLVTGATEGIGKAATMAFAKRGATLVLVARSKEKGEKVIAEVKAASGNDRVSLLLADMSSVKDIERAAAEFRKGHDRLDVLVNNAGAVFTEHKLSADGIEMTFALNHIGYFVLTTALLDLIAKTPGARVVSTSSGAHKMGKIEIEKIVRAEGRSPGFGPYGDSKLANILFTRELAKKLKASGAIANCFHPGYVHTGFGLNTPGVLKSLLQVASPLFARTPEKGAETLIWLATSPEAASFTGEYFHDKKVASTTRIAKDDDLAQKLWSLSENLMKMSEPFATPAARKRIDTQSRASAPN